MYAIRSYYAVLSRILQIIVLVYQAIAVVIFALTLFMATNWLSNPFIGGLFEHTFVLNGSDTSQEGKTWAMYERGFNVGDQLLSVDGVPVSTSDQLEGILRNNFV